MPRKDVVREIPPSDVSFKLYTVQADGGTSNYNRYCRIASVRVDAGPLSEKNADLVLKIPTKFVNGEEPETITVSAVNQRNGDLAWRDVFAVQVLKMEDYWMHVRVRRLDGDGWGQNLELHFQAIYEWLAP